jgi:hypothetical protein
MIFVALGALGGGLQKLSLRNNGIRSKYL